MHATPGRPTTRDDSTSTPGRPTTRDDSTSTPAWTALRTAIGDAIVPCVRAEAEWFSECSEEQRRAARLCGSCIAQKACAEYAIQAGERHGVWGAMLPIDLRREQRRRRHQAA